MTAQAREWLIHERRLEQMATLPLDAHPIARDVDVRAHTGCYSSACWRGYQGVWEVFQDQLWLVGLFDTEDRPMDTHPLFGDSPFPIRADWFSGRLQLWKGPRLMYHHGGWGGVHAQILRLYLSEGRVLKRRRYDQTRRFRQHFLNEFGGAAGVKAWLSEDKGDLGPLTWFSAQGLQVLGLTPAEVAPSWLMSWHEAPEECPPLDEREQRMLAQCCRPDGAPPVELRPEG